jgi:hypothetical protein
MNTTLKTVIDSMEEYIESSLILNTFYSNDITSQYEDNLTYPLVFVQYKPSGSDRGIVELKLEVLFVDILNPTESNYLDVLSNMMMEAINFKTKFRYGEQEGWYIDQSSSVNPFKLELFTDSTAGYSLDVNIVIGDDANITTLPTI